MTADKQSYPTHCDAGNAEVQRGYDFRRLISEQCDM